MTATGVRALPAIRRHSLKTAAQPILLSDSEDERSVTKQVSRPFRLTASTRLSLQYQQAIPVILSIRVSPYLSSTIENSADLLGYRSREEAF